MLHQYDPENLSVDVLEDGMQCIHGVLDVLIVFDFVDIHGLEQMDDAVIVPVPGHPDRSRQDLLAFDPVDVIEPLIAFWTDRDHLPFELKPSIQSF